MRQIDIISNGNCSMTPTASQKRLYVVPIKSLLLSCLLSKSIVHIAKQGGAV